jgi:D-xylose transport system permease protein
MTTTDTTATTAQAPRPARRISNGFGDHIVQYWRRVWGGDMGSLPAILGLLVLVVTFSTVGANHDVFLTAGNFANLLVQGAQVTIIAMGLVFVLLLGEIDLSAGFTSGLTAGVMSVLLVKQHITAWVSIPSAIVLGVVIGLLLGTLVAKVRIPSFVVTLAGFLAFQGVLLLLLSGGQAITVSNDQSALIYAIENKYLPIWAGWLMLVLLVAGYLGNQLIRAYTRARRGLPIDPPSLIALKLIALAAGGGFAVYVLNLERSKNPPHLLPNGRVLGVSLKGVPVVVPVILVLLVVLTFVLTRTAYGRHIYAVGGSAEAARRAGIKVDAIRISAFVICSTLASIAGIVAVSRSNGVSSDTGGSNILLYAVGAAVIGGTSLFGGRGRVVNAILGGAVIAVIDNGMGLLQTSSAIKYVVTGGFLLAAAGLDALSRRRASATGLS